jgi:hypothetical protein
MDRLRIDRDATGPGDASRLDRAWAATRPPELSAEAFDRIWADIQAAYDDRPAALAMTAPTPGRSRRGRMTLVALGLAQLAAAALIAAWALNRPDVGVADAPVPRITRVDATKDLARPPQVVARHEVEADEMLIIELGDGRAVEERRPAPETISSLAMLDLPESTPSDLLGHLEALSR